jgi:hypothetical protein
MSAFTLIWPALRSSATARRKASKTRRRSSGSAAASASVGLGSESRISQASPAPIAVPARSASSNAASATCSSSRSALSASTRSRTRVGLTPASIARSWSSTRWSTSVRRRSTRHRGLRFGVLLRVRRAVPGIGPAIRRRKQGHEEEAAELAGVAYAPRGPDRSCCARCDRRGRADAAGCQLPRAATRDRVPR